MDAIAKIRLGDRGMDEIRRIEWDYSFHFHQGLTRLEGAEQLYQFLPEGDL